MQSQVSLFNARLSVALLVIMPWLAVRNEIEIISSSLRVLLEWCALIVLTVLLTRIRGLPTRVESLAALLLSIVIIYTIWYRSEWQSWPMYWRGFGFRVAIGSVIIAGIFVSLFVLHLRKRIDLRQLLSSDTFQRWNWRIGAVTLVWFVPSVIQPMDAWLNIGDSTQIVLEEISGWAIGHIPGFHQAPVYGSMLGLPMWVLSRINGRLATKFTLVALWANVLTMLVPIVIAAIIRKMFGWLKLTAALSVGLVSILISGDSLGRHQYFNTSLFRELSFVSRILPPLLLAYSLARTTAAPKIGTRQVIPIAVLAGLVSLNNLEFGLSAAGASGLTLLLLTHTQKNRIFLMAQCGLTIGAVWLVAIAPVFWIDASSMGRRLGVFNMLISNEGDLLHSAGAGTLPMFGLVGISFGLSATVGSLTPHLLKDFRFDSESRFAAVIALYISMWTIFSAPYILNSGGSGGFGTQMYFVPFVLMVFALIRLTKLNVSGLDDSIRREPVRSVSGVIRPALTILPMTLMLALVFSAAQQVPAGHREWTRIQTPIASEKWADEWSVARLDWIEPSRVVQLTETFGGVKAVGWWYQHGSAIEMLTGIENLLGVTGFETIRSQAMLELACQPLTKSSKQFVISKIGQKLTLQRCKGLEVQQVMQDEQMMLAVFSVRRSR